MSRVLPDDESLPSRPQEPSRRSFKRDAHFLEACRYVVLNPVRAGLCRSPAQWQWSSYRACAGFTFSPSFLAAGELLKMFGNRPSEAAARYRAFVASARDAGVGHRDEARTRV